jgi:hypothetical protein
MGTGKRKNIEQIPTEDESRGKTGKVVSEQAGQISKSHIK